jgi:hypothetical protein
MYELEVAVCDLQVCEQGLDDVCVFSGQWHMGRPVTQHVVDGNVDWSGWQFESVKGCDVWRE